MSEKQKLLNFITHLNDELSQKDIYYELLAYFKVQNALNTLNTDEIITNEEMEKLILKC